MDTINICFVNENQLIYRVGGVESVSKTLQLEFEKLGHTVYNAFAIQKSSLCKNDILLPDCEKLDSEINSIALIENIKKNNIHIILCQGYTKEIFNLCTKAKKETQTKLIFTFHRCPHAWKLDYDNYKENIINDTKNIIIRYIKSLYCEIKRPIHNIKAHLQAKKFFRAYQIEHIDAFVTLNKEYSNYIKKIFPKEFHGKFEAITNPLVITRDKYEPPQKEKIILFIARLTSQKRLDRLLYIWNDIYPLYPDWRLVIAGEGEYENIYKELSKKLNIERIDFVGQCNPEDLYKKGCILCMTSSHEGFGLVLAEAQLWGCIPIAYNSFASVKDIIINGYNGFLVKPYKKKRYIKAIRTLLDNEQLVAEMAHNGYTFIERFDVKIIAKSWINLFDKLLRNNYD